LRSNQEDDWEVAGVAGVAIDVQDYPMPWPQHALGNWKIWLDKKASSLMEESQMSFVVCDFLENQSLNLFCCVVVTQEEDPNSQSLIFCFGYKSNNGGSNYHQVLLHPNGSNESWEIVLPVFEKHVRQFM
jgi:hypothetical protein